VISLEVRGAAGRIADGYVDHLDMGLAKARDWRSRDRRDPERGAFGEILPESRIDAAAAHLVRAEQDIVGAGRRPARGAGEADIFEVGSRGREDDLDLVRHRPGTPDAPPQRLQRLGIVGPGKLGPGERLNVGECRGEMSFAVEEA
jgi:hypothetical protein